MNTHDQKTKLAQACFDLQIAQTALTHAIDSGKDPYVYVTCHLVRDNIRTILKELRSIHEAAQPSREKEGRT